MQPPLSFSCSFLLLFVVKICNLRLDLLQQSVCGARWRKDAVMFYVYADLWCLLWHIFNNQSLIFIAECNIYEDLLFVWKVT